MMILGPFGSVKEYTMTFRGVLDVCIFSPRPWPYLDPKEPTFLGFLMNSLYKSLKKVGYLGLR